MFKTTIRIDGMSCPMCESHVNDAVRNHFTVKKVTSSYKMKRTEILSEAELDAAALTKAIEEGGYRVEGLSVEPYEEKKKRFWIFG